MKPAIPNDVPKKFRKFLEAPDVFSVDAPFYPDLDGDGPTFPLAYTHSGAGEGNPVLVIIPGGPGFASIVPYATVRPKAVAAGFEVVMVEHRGVGLSRHDRAGEVLPVDAMRVEYAVRDVVRVLDHLGIEKAWLHGTSYGGYLAMVFGGLFPERVRGMFLDCTWRGLEDESAIREYKRDLFLRGNGSDGLEPIAEKVCEILEKGIAPDEEVASVAPPVYEFLGAEALDRLLSARLAGRKAEWKWFAGLVGKELDERLPGIMETDPVMAIWHRQIGVLEPDGESFDTEAIWAERAHRYPPFEGPPLNFSAVLRKFDWPTVLFSGERDTRTPPFVMKDIASLIPNSVHITFPSAGHDLLRFRTKEVLAIERVMVREGIEEAARASEEAVTDGKKHPLTLVGKAFGAYLAARGVLSDKKAKLAARLFVKLRRRKAGK